jgi:hypothetical protein
MRLHGSVMPRMIVPLVFMACWSTLITSISVWVHNRKLPISILNSHKGKRMDEINEKCLD